MKDERIEACEFCKMFDKGKCTLHKIDVCYNDEPCRDYYDRKNDIIAKIEKHYRYLEEKLKEE